MNEVQIIIEQQEININDIVDMFISEHRLKIDIEIAELVKQIPTKEMLDNCLKNDFKTANQDTIDFFINKGYNIELITDNRTKLVDFFYMGTNKKIGSTLCFLMIENKGDISHLTFNDTTVYTTYNELNLIHTSINNTITDLHAKKGKIDDKKQDILAEITKMKLKNSVEGREFLESLNII